MASKINCSLVRNTDQLNLKSDCHLDLSTNFVKPWKNETNKKIESVKK